MLKSMQRRIVDVPPDRSVHVVLVPDGPVRKPDLAPNNMLASGLTRLPHGSRDPVCVAEIKTLGSGGQRMDLPILRERGQYFCCDPVGVVRVTGGRNIDHFP